MRRDRGDVPARRHGHRGRSAGPASPVLRTAGLAGGSCLAVAATVVVLLTDDPRLLRLAVVGAAWAFVLAALVRSRPAADASSPARGQPAAAERADLERAAAEREAELRSAHDRELERAVAARREHELRVEDDLRCTTEQSMRAELEALRVELATLGELRREMAQVAELRRDLAGLRTALAGLDPAALAELRTDVGRLRTELRGQLSGEMLVERVMLRTPSTRPAPEPGAPRTVEADSRTSPAPELTAARPAVRADEPPAGTHQPDEVRAEPRRAPAPPPRRRAGRSAGRCWPRLRRPDPRPGRAGAAPTPRPPPLRSCRTRRSSPSARSPSGSARRSPGRPCPWQGNPPRPARTPVGGSPSCRPRAASPRRPAVTAGAVTGRTARATTSWRGCSAAAEPSAGWSQDGPRDSAPPSSTSVWPVTQPAPSPSR
ncbi:DUF6779 domain-containing protein [Geodermatophilus siccatus]|nr:DUF6779 domain-containing protein [Geodermatophilus siccatus]